MYDVVGSKKVGNGVVVMWDENKELKYDSFNFQELIDLKINVLDLLDRPVSYAVDPVAHRIMPKL
ncbi:MAG: hypothetical protein M0Q92_03525 [Methanoregula sp.]|jgi:hypothetical protein|nr:hypothetical protein [Methanoregula sp.]